MKNTESVMGVRAPPPRPTFQAAALLAGVLSTPFAAIALIEAPL